MDGNRSPTSTHVIDLTCALGVGSNHGVAQLTPFLDNRCRRVRSIVKRKGVALDALLVELGGVVVFELGAHPGAVGDIVFVEFLKDVLVLARFGLLQDHEFQVRETWVVDQIQEVVCHLADRQWCCG